jgi:hypothetical protein
MILSTAMAATAGAQAGKTTAPPPPPDTIPFHTSAVNLDGNGRPDIAADFRDAIPAGKRLVVQHVSLILSGFVQFNPVIGAFCQISGQRFGVGGNGFTEHFIPLTVQQGTSGGSFAAGQAIVMNLDGGTSGSNISMSCSGGNSVTSQLHAELEGLLITK